MFSYYFCVLLFELYFSKDINENLILLLFLMKVVNTIKGTFFQLGFICRQLGLFVLTLCKIFPGQFLKQVFFKFEKINFQKFGPIWQHLHFLKSFTQYKFFLNSVSGYLYLQHCYHHISIITGMRRGEMFRNFLPQMLLIAKNWGLNSQTELMQTSQELLSNNLGIC